jgi:ABC-2 type transport system ATP-binding protein
VAVDTPENLTRQVQGSERVRLVARGPEAAIKGKIQEINGVIRIESSQSEEGGQCVYSIDTELKSDLRSHIARKIVENGYDLLELKTMGMSLEEVFLQLTTQEEGVRSK